MYTIFKNECILILTDSLKNKENNNFFYWGKFDLNRFLQQCDTSNYSTIYLYHADIKFLWEEFKKHFKIIEAAGGIVFNKNNKMLFIFRNGKWDLPKGKVEKGETFPKTAIREVMEECGIFDLTLKHFIATTYHIYIEKDKQILKVSHWYEMYSETEEFMPQIEEDITKAEWKDSKGIQTAIKNTYPNIKLLIKRVIS